jgi:putative hydrolase
VALQAGRGRKTRHPHSPGLALAGGVDPLSEDFHVHSLFSDGTSTMAESVKVARRRGLRRICLVDHTHTDIDAVVRFALTVHAVRAVPGIEVLSGLEATLLDRTGRLDLPAGRLPGIDYVLIADHLFPADLGPVEPREMRAAIRRGEITPREAISCLAEATISAMDLVSRPVLAHLFGVLPELGLAETDVPDIVLRQLADAASAAGALVEVSERRGGPQPRTLRAFASAGVRLVAASGSQDADGIGRYDSVAAAFRALGGPPSLPGRALPGRVRGRRRPACRRSGPARRRSTAAPPGRPRPGPPPAGRRSRRTAAR